MREWIEFGLPAQQSISALQAKVMTVEKRENGKRNQQISNINDSLMAQNESLLKEVDDTKSRLTSNCGA